MSTLLSLVTMTVLALLFFAALHDILVRLIPNWVSIIVFALGVVLRIQEGDWAWSLAATALVFFLCVIAWRFALLGGGDVKLLAAVTPLVAPWDVPALIAAIAMAGGLLALLFILMREVLRRRPAPSGPRRRTCIGRAWRVESRRMRRGGPLPYVVAIALGSAWVALGGGVTP